MMIKVEHSVFINRPADEVFDYIVDPAKESEWQEGVIEAGFSPGSEPGVGAEAFEKRKFMGREMISKFQVLKFEKDKYFVGKVIEGPVPFEVTYGFARETGGTEVTVIIQGEPGGFFKLAEGLVRKQLQSQIALDLERAKDILEGRK
jgi:uncharacterized membrane protein